MDGLGERVRIARDKLGLTQVELAAAVTHAGYKIKQSAIGNIESGRSKKPKCIPELASVLGVSVAFLRTGKEGKVTRITVNPPPRIESDNDDKITDPPAGSSGLLLAPDVKPPYRAEMPRTVPVRGTVSGGRGVVQMSNEAIDWVRRPPRLEGRDDVFALYVEDTSMVPAYRPGGLIFVESVKPPAPGDDVVVELHPEEEHGEQRALLKRLISNGLTVVKLEQYNPPKVLEFQRKMVIRMFRVLTVMDLLGV